MITARVFWLVLPLVSWLVSCTNYKAVVPEVVDEVRVSTVPTPEPPGTMYDHPIRFSVDELSKVLRGVRVEFRTHWLQRWLTGPLKPLPLFEDAELARVVPLLAKALAGADPRERVVFYVAERRTDIHREVTSGALFVRGQRLHIVLVNYRNGVDALAGVPAYDRTRPDLAVAPQRFTLTFEPKEFLDVREPQIFESSPPKIVVDYRSFLGLAAQRDAGPARSW
ncbi:MAG: hypothetical protein E6K60_05630 [Nitrospirae bacterium]|nr:MAG: hypothetical protein E6K60_05630 [Nitrospirota bacterium]